MSIMSEDSFGLFTAGISEQLNYPDLINSIAFRQIDYPGFHLNGSRGHQLQAVAYRKLRAVIARG